MCLALVVSGPVLSTLLGQLGMWGVMLAPYVCLWLSALCRHSGLTGLGWMLGPTIGIRCVSCMSAVSSVLGLVLSLSLSLLGGCCVLAVWVWC